MNPYLVKFDIGDGEQFGVFSKWEGANAIVVDAILPKSYVVPMSRLSEIEMGDWLRPDFSDEASPTMSDEFHQHVAKEFRKALDLNAKLASERGRDTVAPGRLLTVPVGDGRAWYVVTRVSRKSARIEWRGFAPDRWRDNRFGFGGSFPIEMVRCCMYGPLPAQKVKRAKRKS